MKNCWFGDGGGPRKAGSHKPPTGHSAHKPALVSIYIYIYIYYIYIIYILILPHYVNLKKEFHELLI